MVLLLARVIVLVCVMVLALVRENCLGHLSAKGTKYKVKQAQQEVGVGRAPRLLA